MEYNRDMLNVSNENSISYSLGFLKAEDSEFQGCMMKYILEHFGDLLDEDEKRALASGNADALERLSSKFSKMRISRGNNIPA